MYRMNTSNGFWSYFWSAITGFLTMLTLQDVLFALGAVVHCGAITYLLSETAHPATSPPHAPAHSRSNPIMRMLKKAAQYPGFLTLEKSTSYLGSFNPWKSPLRTSNTALVS